MDVIYRDEKIDAGLKLDLLIEGLVVVELKSVQELAPVHEAQILTDLKSSDVAPSQPDAKLPCPLCLRGGEDK